MFDRIGFVIGEAFIALRRNGFMVFAAVTTIAVALFFLGGITVVYRQATEYSKTLPGRFEMRVFLKEGVDFTVVKNTADAMRKIPGVKEVTWIDRRAAWKKEQIDHPEQTEGIENPFPEAYKIILSDLEKGEKVAETIQKLPNVDPKEGVQFMRREQQIVDQVLKFMQWLAGLGLLLLLTAGILIFNAIRMTILSRRLEIRIMELVGASPFTVRVPFVLEGFVQGVVGGGFAALLLVATQVVLQKRLLQIDPAFVLPPVPLGQLTLVLAALGGAYGVVCSWIAVRVPMRS
jgi:cell division transport system permease protein